MKILSILSFLIVFITSCNSVYPEFGNGYKLFGDGGYTDEVLDSTNSVIIPECILDYAFDSTFIIVKQSPPNMLPSVPIIVYTQNDRKRLSKNDKIFKQYWIVNKKQKPEFSYDSIKQIGSYSNV